MVFSSTIFVFFYLPVTLIGLFLCPKKWKNGWLLIMSLLFLGWFCFFPDHCILDFAQLYWWEINRLVPTERKGIME